MFTDPQINLHSIYHFFKHGFDKTISSDFFSLYNFSLQIPGAETATISAISGGVALATNSGRLCGRVLNSATSAASTIAATVCGKSKLYSYCQTD